MDDVFDRMAVKIKNHLVQDKNNWDIVVKPKSKFSLNLSEVLKYKDLIILMAKRDITAIYKQTILGPIWMIVQPIFTTAIYTFTFSYTAKLSTDNIPPLLFFLMGLSFWGYFSDTLSKTSNTFVNNASVFGKVYFPRIVVPLSILISNLVKLVIQLLLVTIVYFYYFFTSDSIKPNNYILILPLLIFMLGLFGLSLGIIFSSVSTKYRDFTFLLTFAIQLLMFASCVTFPLSIYPSKYQSILLLNPLVSVMEAIKFSLTGNGFFNALELLKSSLIILSSAFIGLLIFNKTEKTFMDTV